MNLLRYILGGLLVCQLLAAPAFAEVDNDAAVAELFGDQVIPTTTFGRQVRPLNGVAENVTVITKEDIERLQAHSLGDLLQFYPGVLAYPFRYSFDLSVPMVQGLPNRQTLVTIDGVPVNGMSDGTLDINLIAMGFVERVEIVKGPAASVWGRSVGAVINLVSQNPNRDRLVTGQMNVSTGTKAAKVGEIQFNGFIPKTGTGYFLIGQGDITPGYQTGIGGENRSVYAKLNQDLGPKTLLTGIFIRSATESNILHIPAQNVRGEYNVGTYFGIGNLHHEFAPGSEFDAQIYASNFRVNTNIYNLAPIPTGPPPFPVIPSGTRLQAQGFREETEGIQLSYKLNKRNYWLTFGVDSTISSLRNTDISLAPPPKNNHSTKYIYNVAEYISGGLNITDDLTLTGSYRYDWYNMFEDTHSPSLGLIYKLTDKTLFRTSYSYGYSLPTVASGTSTFETLWRVQGGVESNEIPGLWLKVNGFYDRTKNVKLQLKFFDQNPEVNHALTREGFEVEAKTIPVYNLSLGLGYSYTHIFNTDTSAQIQGLPRHHFLASLNYKNTVGTDATIFARYINWNAPTAKDQVVWDFLLTQRIYDWEWGNANLTFSARNIFDASQQASPVFNNAPARYEGGFRINF